MPHPKFQRVARHLTVPLVLALSGCTLNFVRTPSYWELQERNATPEPSAPQINEEGPDYQIVSDPRSGRQVVCFAPSVPTQDPANPSRLACGMPDGSLFRPDFVDEVRPLSEPFPQRDAQGRRMLGPQSPHQELRCGGETIPVEIILGRPGELHHRGVMCRDSRGYFSPPLR